MIATGAYACLWEASGTSNLISHLILPGHTTTGPILLRGVPSRAVKAIFTYQQMEGVRGAWLLGTEPWVLTALSASLIVAHLKGTP